MQSKCVIYYVYRISHKETGLHYYGSKTAYNSHPTQLGTTYFTSSRNKPFKTEFKIHPERFKIKIIKEFTTTKACLEYEIKLHEKFDVGKNSKFYNIVKQTNTGFSTAGCKLPPKSNEFKRNMSKQQTELMANRTKSEKRAIVKKRVLTMSNYSAEEKETLRIKQSETAKKREAKYTKEENAIRRTKVSNSLKENYSNKSDEEKIKRLEKIRRTKANNPVLTCPHCQLKSKNGSGVLTRLHFDNCLENPNLTTEERAKRKLLTKQKIVQCIHCNKTGSPSNISRWHNDNCTLIKPRTTTQCKHCDKKASELNINRWHNDNCKKGGRSLP